MGKARAIRKSATKGLSKPKKTSQPLNHPALTKRDLLVLGVTTGTASSIAGTQTNNAINKARSVKSNYYKRRLKNGKTVKVRKSPAHGVGYNQQSNVIQGGVMY